MNSPLLPIARALHRSAFLRQLARRVCRGVTIRQPFHHGTILMDAVDHSWSWIGGRRLDTFDRDLQDHLLDCVRPRGLLIDIGCNVGVMTLSVLLRDPQARAICVDPNARAIGLLARSLELNRCAERATLVNAAVSATETELRYESSGSFIGHVAATGSVVPAVPLSQLIARHLSGPVVLKIDVEGFETQLAAALAHAPLPANSIALVELHPLGFNGAGDPVKFLSAFRGLQRHELRLLDGSPLSALDSSRFQQLEISWRS